MLSPALALGTWPPRPPIFRRFMASLSGSEVIGLVGADALNFSQDSSPPANALSLCRQVAHSLRWSSSQPSVPITLPFSNASSSPEVGQPVDIDNAPVLPR